MATELQINEDSFGEITATLQDESGTAIALTDIDSLEMTLIEVHSGDIINSRQKQNVLNTNNCTVHATSGLFTWNVQPDDTSIEGSTRIGQREEHLATFTLTWDTTKQLHFEILLQVLNLRSVPQTSS